jgi:hypothetical protein
MYWRPSDLQDRGELQFIDVFAGLEGTGDDAVLDSLVRRVPERSGCTWLRHRY